MRAKPGGTTYKVNHRNQLMYARRGANGGIKVFDISDDSPSEKSAGSGGGFIMSGNGKKILVPMGRSAMIRDAGPGGGGDRVITDPMLVIDLQQKNAQLLFHFLHFESKIDDREDIPTEQQRLIYVGRELEARAQAAQGRCGG